MGVDVYAVCIFDGDEHVACAVFQDWADSIVVGGVDSKGQYHQFESEAYHLREWCEHHGFTLLNAKKRVEFDFRA